MPDFHAAFKTWSEQHPDVSIRQLSITAEIANSELSRIHRGLKEPTFESISKLLPAVAKLSSLTEARTLLVAYLHDETPPEFKKHVRIQPLDETGNIDENDPIRQEAIRWERRARSDPEFASMWLTLGGYTFEADADAVDARVHQFEAAQATKLGLAADSEGMYMPGPQRTLGQILAGYDLHTLADRTGIAQATLQRLQDGAEPLTMALLGQLSFGLSQPDLQDLQKTLPLTPAAPPSVRTILRSYPYDTLRKSGLPDNFIDAIIDGRHRLDELDVEVLSRVINHTDTLALLSLLPEPKRAPLFAKLGIQPA